MSFTARLLAVIAGAAIAAAIVAPFAAAAVAALGFHFPFPRIFDRTVMVAVAILLIWQWHRLRLTGLLRRGFAGPLANLSRVIRGLLAAVIAVGVLIVLAILQGAHANQSVGGIWIAAGKYLGAAILIAIIEEGFFRAILLAGMEDDFGRTPALIISAAIYSIAHLIRSPAKFYIRGVRPLAGLQTLGMSLGRLEHFGTMVPTFIGLFLLGILLGEAFLVTGTVYLAIGLHAGLVLGAKLWPRITSGDAGLPRWLAGWGPQPLISGVAAWIIALALLLLVRPLARADRRT